MEGDIFHKTEQGTVQGGTISPTLANMTLDGMETAIREVVKAEDKVNFIRYADDFVITANTQDILESKVKPVISAFLKERGLELSSEKTKITHINKGFDFLGFNIRKYAQKLLIKPAKGNVKRFLKEIREYIKANKSVRTDLLIINLNPKIRGWASYYRHVVSKKTFSRVDNQIFLMTKRWSIRRHPEKNAKWRIHHYYRTKGFDTWTFYAKTINSMGEKIIIDLAKATETPIKRYVKIRAEANPYSKKYAEYLDRRTKRGLNCTR